MRLGRDQIRRLMKERGWTNIQLAGHWGLALNYVSWLINHPLDRPRVYDDAFRGLLPRDQVEVTLEGRHRRPQWTPRTQATEAMFPPGARYITENSTLGLDEGTELEVVSMRRGAKGVQVTFRIASGEGEGDVIELDHPHHTNHLASDTRLP